jgi:hypothetical protein
MSALTVLLIRHAEKPDDPSLGAGLTPQGDEDKHSLVIRGWQRAGAWAALFGCGMGGADYPTPDVVYAADPASAPSSGGSISRRPYETVLPLCERLHIKPVTSYGVGGEGKLIDAVQRSTGVVLICWEHKKIAEVILPGLAARQKLPHLPGKWNGDRFDVVLRLDRAQAGAPWSFRQLFPRLLGGDSNIPLGS